MSRKVLFGLIAAAVIGLVSIPFLKEGGNAVYADKVDPAFSEYISAFTSGYVSKQSTIRIILTGESPGFPGMNQPAKDPLFEFSPSIEGTTVWVDARTIEFRPKEPLPSGQNYEAIFLLSKVMNVAPEFEEFKFYFSVIEQSMEVYIDGMKTIDKKNMVWQKITGMIATADVAVPQEIEKVLAATVNGKSLKVRWEHGEENRHRFSIDSVERKEKPVDVSIEWNGEYIGVKSRDSKVFNIPALGDFKVMDIKAVNEPEQYVSILFSDPLLETQSLEGLIIFSDAPAENNFKFTIEENEVKAYPVSRQSGTRTVTVKVNVKNIMGFPLKDWHSMELHFSGLKPQVVLSGKGVILPSSADGFVLPFQAVSLKAVDVQVVKIFENNIAQFLQVNDLAGEREMKRVGRVVLKKTIALNPKSKFDLYRWGTYYLDLTGLINTEPGAIYRVTLGFRKQHSVCPCEGVDGTKTELAEVDEPFDPDNNEDDRGSGYYDYDYYGDYYEEEYYEEDVRYDYRERDNPCSPSFYKYNNHSVSRNILASDIGIVAKKGASGQMTMVVTDLRTTQPLSGIPVELYNYQQQLITSVKTNSDGIAEVDGLKKVPFLLVAKKNEQRGYLKLEEGSALSLSMFDVSGTTVQKGLKGFIYGERGVWRPGDSLFLTFMLEDKQKTLPANHPVTFELRNPKWQVVRKITSSKGLNGVYAFATSTESSAPTGTWNARVMVGGATFSKDIKIETIMPNRLKLRLDFGKDKIYSDAEKAKGELEVKWLHGAIAKNLKAKVDVTLNQQSTTFKGYDKYTFDDPATRFYTEQQTIFEDRLNEEGKASVLPDFKVKSSAPGMLKASFICRVFEEGGNFSIDRFSLPYSPFSSYVGLRMPEGNGYGNTLVTDTNHVIQIATLDEQGKPVSRNKLMVKVYKVQWRWWWDHYGDDLGQYAGDQYHQPYYAQEISTVNGKGQFVLRVNRPDWGRFLVRITDPESGHSAGETVYVDWPAWAGRSQKDNGEGASILSFTADKEKYAPGDQMKLIIPSSEGGRVLVSLETGTKVLRTTWAETKKGTTEVLLPVTPEMAPNIYAHVTLVQPHAQTLNDLPIRMYGVIPVSVEDPMTHLRPVIRTAEFWRPEEKASVTVSEESGKPMTYTLAMVDEGLLDITRFETPDPWKNFYTREALGVRTWDMYDQVIGAFGALMQKLLAIGGDGDAAGKGGAKANRFKPMVKFMGPFHLEKGQKTTHEFMMPRYVGSVRVMVVAAEPSEKAGGSAAYGSADKAVAVKKPVMVLATLPRVVGPNETVDLPVTVFAMEKSVKNVTVEVQANKYFSPLEGTKKTINFKSTGDEVINFPMKINPVLGIGKVTVVATSGKEKATFDIEIDVRAPNPKITDFLEAVIEPGKSWNTDYQPVGMAGTNKGTLEISSIPPVNLDYRLKYLIQYPHGCVEQTTSSAFPQLFLADIMELNSDFKSSIDNNIKAAIRRLTTFQTSSGGMGYWPGDAEPNDWGSSYAGHFLLEAEAKGFDVPSNLLENWKKYQKKLANTWTYKSKTHSNWYYNDDLMQAYRLYTLALAKSPELGAMNRLREAPELSVNARWRLAAAYALAGQAEVARKMIQSAPTRVNKYSEMSYSYGSSERDEAMIIEALCILNDRLKAVPMVKDLSNALSSSAYWMSTQTTSYALIAISRFAKVGDNTGTLSYSYSVNGSEAVNKNTKLPLSQIKMNIKGSEAGKVSVTNTGKGMMYARVVLEGIPEAGDATSAESNLGMNISYHRMDGSELDVTRLEQGTDFYAEVTISNTGIRNQWYKEMALTQIFPSGWEIHNTRMDEVESTIKSSWPTYQDIRDDRVYTYFDVGRTTPVTFRIILNAAYLGRFYLPTVLCEAMYDNTIHARKPGKWVEVVRPGAI